MPELPEVETIVRQLRPKIKGRIIKRVEIGDKKVANFKDLRLKIKDIRRRAKLIIIELDKNKFLIIHLKMTGRLLWRGQIDKHARAIFHLDKSDYFVFQDWRRFGYVKLLTGQQLQKILARLGPEPLAPDFTLVKLEKMLKLKPRAKIKPLLMDQNWLAGVGNIYAQEICFCAGIRPQRRQFFFFKL